MATQNYQYQIRTSKTPKEAFDFLSDPCNWWTGLFGETIEGKSKAVGDEFTFAAGDGIHYSKQKLVTLVQEKSIVWEVTDSALSFIDQKDEWTGTKLSFEITARDKQTEILFTHIGLVPDIGCYGQCAPAWDQYFAKMPINDQTKTSK